MNWREGEGEAIYLMFKYYTFLAGLRKSARPLPASTWKGRPFLSATRTWTAAWAASKGAAAAVRIAAAATAVLRRRRWGPAASFWMQLIRRFLSPWRRDSSTGIGEQQLETGFWIRIHWFRIRIQHFRLNTDPDPGFWWTKIGKNLQLKKICYGIFLIKNCN